MTEYIEVECDVLCVLEHSVFVRVGDREMYIPKASIDPDELPDEPGNDVSLLVATWWCRMEGLV